MTVSTVSPTTATTGTTNSSSSNKVAGEASLADNFNTFLTLLTTQLKNQDPLKPMDSTQFTNQLVQFSEVEQSINQNKHLEQLVSMQNTNQAVAAINYIGNKVEATGTDLPLVNGSGEMSYTLPENATRATVLITNSSGQLVRTISGDTTAGKHTLTWDGKGSNGSALPDGTYTVSVSAQNADKKTLDVPTSVYGTVTGTESDSNGTYVTIGGTKIGLDKIVSVSKSPTV